MSDQGAWNSGGTLKRDCIKPLLFGSDFRGESGRSVCMRRCGGRWVRKWRGEGDIVWPGIQNINRCNQRSYKESIFTRDIQNYLESRIIHENYVIENNRVSAKTNKPLQSVLNDLGSKAIKTTVDEWQKQIAS